MTALEWTVVFRGASWMPAPLPPVGMGSAAVEQRRARRSVRSPTEGAQEPAQPAAAVAMSMVPRAGSGRLGVVDELGAAGTGRTCGAGQGGDVDVMSADCGVDALSSGQTGCGGLVADRVVKPVNGAGKRGRP